MELHIRQLGKTFGTTTVLGGVTFDVADRELFFLLGPSGCGKTTLLRLLAGFYQPDAGEIVFGDRRMNGVEPHRRNTGMVFQNYALWPHMTVAQNVSYGLDVRRMPASEKRDRVRSTLGIVHLEGLADRLPNQLSGGQQQRVALARALVIRPDVLLLDEPLSNLDARLRLEMRDEIRRIHEETHVTTIYVTHDQKEALSMADRMAVLRDGLIEQIGRPRDVYRAPSSRFVADFIGEANWLGGTVSGSAARRTAVDTSAGPLVAELRTALPVGARVDVGFRPEAIRHGPAGENSFEAELKRITYLGETEQYALRLADGTCLKAFEQNPEAARIPGSRERWHVSARDLFLLPVDAPPGPPGSRA